MGADDELPSTQAQQLARLLCTCFATADSEPSPAHWRWVVTLDGQVAAYVAIRALEDATSGLRLGHLAYMATDPACRGRGLATKLLAHVQADAPALGLDGVVLHAEPSAQGLYQRCGWQVVAPHTWYLNDQYGDEDPVMAWPVRPGVLEALRRPRWEFTADW